MGDIFYKIEIDGKPRIEEYSSFDKATEGAVIYFANNRTFREAVIYRIQKECVGSILNKRQEK